MKTLSTPNYNRARDFVKTKARPVEQALFAWTFEGGKPEAVWDAVRGFANEDGGFGHGMEPDCRLPASSALATTTAFPYLMQTRAPATLPLVRNGIRYLLDTYDRDLQGWRMLPPEANNYPRACWWNYDTKAAAEDVLRHWSNPSAAVLAIMFRYKVLVPETFIRDVTSKAMTVFDTSRETLGEHDFLTFVDLAAELPDPAATALWDGLKKQARVAVQTDPSQWTGYGLRPLWAVPEPGSPLMPVLGDAVNTHIDFEIDHQQHDGSWHPFWSWGQFEAEWEIAKIEWQGAGTVKLLRSLKAFTRIER